MVWNTIAHPKMMQNQNPGGVGSFSPIKFADPHKLSFYDIIVSTTGPADDRQPILIKGDFETIKKMLLNGEAVCGAIFMSRRDDESADLLKVDVQQFSYAHVLDAIKLAAADNPPLYLLSDNTISSTSPEGGPKKITYDQLS